MILFLENLLQLFLEAAPWLLFGLIAAGLLQAWVPESALRLWIGGQGGSAIARAALAGAPLPLCSCGVLPAALGLRRAGASRGATVSFLIATPETGPDSIAISWGLLGPFMAVLRPVAAVLSAIAAGLLTSWTDSRDTDEQRGSDPSAAPVTGCCSSAGSCCDAAQPAAESNSTSDTPESALAGLRYAFTAILDDIAPWLAVGLVLAALVATWSHPW